jgi:excisionase family DNA binding protein
MRRGELFDLTELRIPLTPDQKNSALRRIIYAARCSARYTYTIKEACGILNISRDEIDHLIRFYRLDALALGVIYRIPWYSLAEYLLDTDDDLEEVFDEYIRSRYRTV